MTLSPLKMLLRENLIGLHVSDEGLELLSSVLHVLEQVEACAAWAQQNGVTGLGQFAACFHAVGHGMGVSYLDAFFLCNVVEEAMQFGVVGSQVNQCTAFVQHQILDFCVVIAFVLPADDEYGGGVHALQGIPAGIHVCGFGVVDVGYTAHGARMLKTVLHTGEVAKALPDDIVVHAGDVGGEACCQRVVDIVFAGEAECLLLHVEGRGLFQFVLALLDVTDGAFLLQFREWVLDGLDVVFLQLPFDDGVVVPVDEAVFLCLVLYDAHLGVHVVLHAVVVAVEVVGRDVQQDGDVGTEVIHVVQLEGTQFDDVVFVWVLGHLQGQAVADVSGESCIVTGGFEYVVDERGGRCLAIAACDADHLGMRVSSGELYFTDDGYSTLDGFLHDGCLVGYAGAFDDFVCVEYFPFGVCAFFPRDVSAVEHLLVTVLDGRHVGDEHVVPFFLCQCSSAGTTFAGAQYYYSFHFQSYIINYSSMFRFL